ncbi:hypothetical protein ACE7GA_21860 [Roseomonas sp. CCTCC AB2023176]|uniref:hypothetical protein n=1 Tax=Roseomonas sp. CCTCC AB2023176 TaxID=3342640 RepID=UPI0035D899E3
MTRDALLRGLPLLLSEAAAAGLDQHEGAAFVVARSRAECVAHLLRLVQDPARRRALGEGAFRLGRACFGRAAAGAAARGIADLATSLARAA